MKLINVLAIVATGVAAVLAVAVLNSRRRVESTVDSCVQDEGRDLVVPERKMCEENTSLWLEAKLKQMLDRPLDATCCHNSRTQKRLDLNKELLNLMGELVGSDNEHAFDVVCVLTEEIKDWYHGPQARLVCTECGMRYDTSSESWRNYYAKQTACMSTWKCHRCK
jgi:hypothetical protein